MAGFCRPRLPGKLISLSIQCIGMGLTPATIFMCPPKNGIPEQGLGIFEFHPISILGKICFFRTDTNSEFRIHMSLTGENQP